MEWLPREEWPSNLALLGLEETNGELNDRGLYNYEHKKKVSRNQLFAVFPITRYRGATD